MSIFNWSKKSLDEISPDMLPEGLEIASNGSSDYSPYIPPYQAYLLAAKNTELGKVVSDISDDTAMLKKGLQVAPRAPITYTSPLLEILQNPGGGLSGFQFMRAITESYLLTAMAFFVIRGRINGPALELVYLFPWELTWTINENDGQPLTFTTTSNKDRRVYSRVPSGNGYRYIDALKLNELISLRGPLSFFDGWSGKSRLPELFYDLEMNIAGKRHNTSMLKNGLRTSAILSPATTGAGDTRPKWGAELVKKIAQKLRFFNQGAGNAGNILVLGTPANIQGLNQTNKDMDYVQLSENSKQAIYNTYKYPLPLVLSSTMTLDNYTVAVGNYFTNAVYPVFEALASGFVSAFKERYNLPPTTIMTFSEIDIRAMQGVIISRTKELNAMQVFSKNEIRRMFGYQDEQYCDEIYVPGNMLPLSALAASPEFPGSPDTVDREEESTPDMPEEDGKSEYKKAYPGEHAARMIDPDKFQDKPWSRVDNTNPNFTWLPEGVSVILGVLKGGTGTTIQAYRFSKELWTPARAREWLSKHDINPLTFEDATDTKGFINFHTAKIIPKEKFKPNSFVTQDNQDSKFKWLPNGVLVVLGVLKGETGTTVHSYWFPKNMFTVAQVRDWLDKHKISELDIIPSGGTDE